MGIFDFYKEKVCQEEGRGKEEVIRLEEGVIYNMDVVKALSLIEEESVDVCFTSPPYNVGKKYGGNGKEDRKEWGEYFDWAKSWIEGIYRVLKGKGFFILNIPMSLLEFRDGKKSIPIGFIYVELCMKAGFEYYGTIVWDKDLLLSSIFNRLKYDTTTTNPPLFEGYELLIVFRKPKGKKTRNEENIQFPTPAEAINLSCGVWKVSPENLGRLFHPAPFPYELAYRTIKLFSAKGETILDPFAGSGTTLLASVVERRKFIGIEKERKYIDLFLQDYENLKKKRNIIYS